MGKVRQFPLPSLKEFVPASSAAEEKVDTESLAQRKARHDHLLHLRNTCPGSDRKRQAALRAGVGEYIEEPPRFEAPQLSSKIRGSVREPTQKIEGSSA